MKVNIGKFPNRLTCRIHTRYMDKKYGYIDWPTEYTPFEARLEWLEDRIQDFYDIFNSLWFDKREQKIKVRIDRQDTWSMDHTLAPIILPMLKQLKETKHGAPNVDMEDVPKELHPKKQDVLRYKELGETDDKFFKRWDWVMDEMIWAFEQKCRVDWMSDYYGVWMKDDSDFKGVDATDYEGLNAHQDRMTNGFRLFGKYYESLWD